MEGGGFDRCRELDCESDEMIFFFSFSVFLNSRKELFNFSSKC